MEALKEQEFLAVGSGSGSGSGSGYGDGSGYGSGDGSGSGYGSGSGDGDGKGIGAINGEKVYMVDGMPTILRSIKGNVAKGGILMNDFTINPCFVAKQGNLFAHGDTLREAMDALRGKLFENMPEDERIAKFIKAHDYGGSYPRTDFFDWHHRLTGSCLAGRKAFAENHGLVVDDSPMTVREFIKLTRNAYGGEIIRRLEAAYKGEEIQL